MAGLDHQLLRVPLETLSKDFRLMQKRVERDLHRMETRILDPTFQASDIPEVLEEAAALRKKVEEYMETGDRTTELLQARLDQLDTPHPTLDLITEYLLRNGMEKAATPLLSSHSTKLPTVDAQELRAIDEAVGSLRRRNLDVALAWAQSHGSRLRRLESPLEFELRVQQFVELVRQGRREAAIACAQEHLGPAARAAVASPSAKPTPGPGDTPFTTPGGDTRASWSGRMSPLRLGETAMDDDEDDGSDDDGAGNPETEGGRAATSGDASHPPPPPPPVTRSRSRRGDTPPSRAQRSSRHSGGRRVVATPTTRPVTPVSAASTPGRTPSRRGNGSTPDPLQRLQQLMSLLAFDEPTRCGIPDMERLFEDQRWDDLNRLFEADALRASGFLPASRLRIQAVTGAASLKSPFDETGGRPPVRSRHGSSQRAAATSPLSDAPPAFFRALRNRVPQCRRSQTQLLCALTGSCLNDSNRPLVLPTGYVIGTDAWLRLGQGKDLRETLARVQCPFTGRLFRSTDVRLAYTG